MAEKTWRCKNCGTPLIYVLTDDYIPAYPTPEKHRFFCAKCQRTWAMEKGDITLCEICPFLITKERKRRKRSPLVYRYIACALRQEKGVGYCNFKGNDWAQGYERPIFFECPLFKEAIAPIVKKGKHFSHPRIGYPCTP